jgi:DNA polymerase-4
LFGDGAAIAADIRQRIRSRTGLTASVGVAENKLVAKIASDLDKPDGLVVVTADNLRSTLDPLPVSVIPGIGRQTLVRLHAIEVRTVRDLRLAAARDLQPIFGRYTQKTRDRAAGIDDRPVEVHRDDKSISAETTFDRDIAAPADLQRELLRLTERAARRMQKAALAAGTVQVKIRQGDFSTFTRQRSLHPASNSTNQIFACARELLDTWLHENPGVALRLLGVGGSRLVPASQGDLFAASDSAAPVDATVNDIRDRFGDTALGRARSLGDPSRGPNKQS